MLIKADFSVLRTAKWQEYGIRFLVGGLITAAAGLVSKEFGPSIGGLFLAFPAIFPASATLVEKHVAEQEQKHGGGVRRGRQVAGVEAAGAAMGSIGLLSFAAAFRILVTRLDPWWVFLLAALAWTVVSGSAWALRRRLRRARRA